MTDVDPADAFGALSDPVRVEILEVLADHWRENPDAQGLRFSELRKAVGVRDSGRFRYHLEKLRDAFVEQDEEGNYHLNYAGTEVVTAIVRGSYTDEVTLGPTEIDSECSTCGTTATATYEDGILRVQCENDHPLFTWSLPPNAAEDATVEEVIETATLLLFQTVELTLAGTCSGCHARVTPEVRPTDGAGQPYRIHSRCDACGSTISAPVGVALTATPELEALFHRHGNSIRRGYWWEKAFVREDVAIERLDEDPLRLQVAVDVGDERLTAVLDENGAVRETTLTDR